MITELGTGEALVSLLDATGTPGITRRAWMLAPGSQIGPITPDDRRTLITTSVVGGVYQEAVDRESAFEMLKARADAAAAAPVASPAGRGSATPTGAGGLAGVLFGTTGPRGGKRDGLLDIVAKSAARSTGTAISRGIVRGVLGSLLGGRRR